ncbi:MAG TPA: membrane protein insertase YidC [bacterium]
MERRIILAAVISAIFLSLYMPVFTKSVDRIPVKHATDPSQTDASTPVAAPLADVDANAVLSPAPEEKTAIIESQQLAVSIGVTSGSIRRVVLKDFSVDGDTARVDFGGDIPLVQFHVGNEGIEWQLDNRGPGQILLSGRSRGSTHFQLAFDIDQKRPVVHVRLTGAAGQPFTAFQVWQMERGGDGDRFSRLEAIAVVADQEDGKRSHKSFGVQKKIKNVPRGTLFLTLAETYFCQSLKPSAGFAQSVILASPSNLIATKSTIESSNELSLYFGPRDYFYMTNAGFDEAIPVGILGKIGLMMLSFLGWAAGITGNYGVSIILFACLVTIIMAPFSLMGFRSIRKLQELQPRQQAIMEKYKSDPQRAQREVFALYKEHKVSPLGGCLPMLVQFPVIIAFFRAIPHYIALRGAGFLWIKDLSLPDKLFSLPFTIPWFGGDFNILPIIMGFGMYLQTKMSQGASKVQSNAPGAKLMSGPLMPAMFLVMCYNLPSSLMLYWVVNSLLSIAIYRVAK